MKFKLISRVVLAAVIGGLALSSGACSLLAGPQYRDPASGQITATASIDSSALQVGDCIVNISETSDAIDKISVAPCSEPHEAEVYAIGTSKLNQKDILEEFCTEEFEPYIGISWQNSQLSATYVHAEASKATTDVQCIVYVKGVMVTQSYKGSQQ